MIRIPQPRSSNAQETHASLVSSQTLILLQTARMFVSDDNNPDAAATLEVRAILDPVSQRSYISGDVQLVLNLKRDKSGSLIIRAFGSKEGTAELVKL